MGHRVMTKERKRVTWTVTAVCYPDDLEALRADVGPLFIDGLLGGFALDATMHETAMETFEDEDADNTSDGPPPFDAATRTGMYDRE